MKDDFVSIYGMLHRIYQRHRSNHPENPDSNQMCCMWSTDNPPDIVEGTSPFEDIEDAFGILIDKGAALALYDMDLHEAARKITEMRQSHRQR